MSKHGEIDGVRIEPGLGVSLHGSAAVGKWSADSIESGMHVVGKGTRLETSVEVFHHPTAYQLSLLEPGDRFAPGWYWWPCQPGRLPDAEPMGPFETSTLALANATEEYAQ